MISLKKTFIYLIILHSVTSCIPEECCDSGDRRPSFFYLDKKSNDLLNPKNLNSYIQDSISLTLIQGDRHYMSNAKIVGGYFQYIDSLKDTIQVNFAISFPLFPADYQILETTEVLLIHLNNRETDTIIYETFFPNKKDPTYTNFRNLTVNGVPYERNEGGYITIIKNE